MQDSRRPVILGSLRKRTSSRGPYDRDFKSACKLLYGFNCGNGVPVFNARNVAAKQACALFQVTLGEFLCLAHFAEAVADNHGGIVSLRGGEGKPGAPWHCSCFHSAAVGW
jgi:hypothetical protein